MTHFLRLLKTDIDAKGDALAEQVRALNTGQPAPNTFTIAPTKFNQIPGSPFAYWAKELIWAIAGFTTLEPSFGNVVRGPEPHDLEQSLRLWVEVNPSQIGPDRKWVNYAKGGEVKSYAPDLHLVIDYAPARDGIRPFRRPGDNGFYFKPGATYTQRTTSRFTLRVMHKDCLTSPKGPGIVPSKPEWIWYLMALGNSILFQRIVELKVGAADVAARSYDLHIIRDIPVPVPDPDTQLQIEEKVRQALDLAQSFDRKGEFAHEFCLPALAYHRGRSLQDAAQLAQAEAEGARNRLAAIQSEIDEIVTRLYGLTAADFAEPELVTGAESETEAEDDEADEDTEARPDDVQSEVQALLQWCVGCAFGRWDVRFALDPTLLPKLQGPFDPLPRCSPGTLVSPDGLPAQKDGIVSEAWLRARPDVITLPPSPPPPSPFQGEGPGVRVESTIPDSAYPLRIDWDGILVDDDDHPDDIVRRVRDVLELLWGDRAEAVEREACQLLGVDSLREYFRQPRNFFDFHIKRYSKSRRKAPVYWLLQSAKKSYGLRLYYHRMDADTLFKALTLYADPKLKLENIRLHDLRGQLKPDLPARDRRALEKAIAKQEALIGELTDFRDELERIARLGLTPDFNDGVIINIAPLHTLTPWKEAEKMWAELTRGQYGWAAMSQRLRERGLVKGTGD